jgi:hypothetical protein
MDGRRTVSIARHHAAQYHEQPPRQLIQISQQSTAAGVGGGRALNFIVHDALDGGITSSPRLDKVAKAMAQQLLEFPISVPRSLNAHTR